MLCIEGVDLYIRKGLSQSSAAVNACRSNVMMEWASSRERAPKEQSHGRGKRSKKERDARSEQKTLPVTCNAIAGILNGVDVLYLCLEFEASYVVESGLLLSPSHPPGG